MPQIVEQVVWGFSVKGSFKAKPRQCYHMESHGAFGWNKTIRFFRIKFLTRIQYFILYFKIIFLVEDIGHEFYLQ
jgi:hypothetical protein